jgi:HK97 family phage major capsid protein
VPFNSLTTRVDVGPLIPEETARDIIQVATEDSAVLSLFRRVGMGTAQQRMPVLSARPVAYFVNGDTGLKQTSELAWSNKYLNVEEIAVIIPIADAVLEDTAYDLWGEARPLVAEAIGRKLDGAVFFGTDAPVSWPTNINSAAVTAGNVTAIGASDPGEGGIAGDLNLLWGTVEDDGFDPNGVVADRRLKGLIRGARGTDGQPLMDVQGNVNQVMGERAIYAMRGQWPTGVSAARAFAGDWDQFVLAIRRDISIDFSKDAVITDNSTPPNIIYNLWQQDMTAMRCTFRVAWQVANPVTHEQSVDANRYPVGVLRTAAA